MAHIRPFRAIRPADHLAPAVAALPYDVMTSDEARVMVQGKPHSFLRVDRAEVDLPPDVDPYSPQVYEHARDTILSMIERDILRKDHQRCYYIYTLEMNGRVQSGLVATAAIDDYRDNIVKKHEHTRKEKEADRTRHVDVTDHHTGPIFLTYVDVPDIDAVIADWQSGHAPVHDFVADDGVRHTVWTIDETPVIERLTALVEAVPALYIADGHHRTASAVDVGYRRRSADPAPTGAKEYDYFLAVLFPRNQLAIMDYNRVLAEQPTDLMERLAEHFDVTPAPAGEPWRPIGRHDFGLYVDGVWHRMQLKHGIVDESDPVSRLDVAILQDLVLAPVFGIEDPRTDRRIDFVGGIRGLGELEKRCSDDMKVAFALYPTSLDDLMAIADAGMVMPPKSTWFEPKMRSGLFLHSLSDN